MGLVGFCIILIAITSINSNFLTPLRTGVGFFLTPVQTGVNTVGTSLYNRLKDISNLNKAVEENKQLKIRIDQLVEENNRLQEEQLELARLRELYSLDQEYLQYEKIGARVIASDSGNWFKVFRIDKGSSDGIEVNSNVMAGGGLVGIVTDVGANYATVRMIIDDSNNVSAMTMDTNDTCIVSGDLKLFNTEGKISLSHIKKDADIKEGDKIVTSNISDIYLPGILIGYVTDVSVDANNLTKSGNVLPVAEFDNLQEVLVITKLKDVGTGE